MALRLIGVLLIGLLAGTAWAQPVYQAACMQTCNGCDTFSTSCTAVGTDRLAVVGAWYFPSTRDVSAITYGGVSIAAGVVDTFPAYNSEETLWRVIAPAASAQTLEITLTGSADLRFGALLLSGAHQTTPLGTAAHATANGTAMSVTATTAADELVVALGASTNANVTISPGANETERWSLASAGTNETAMYTQPGASGGAMTPALSEDEEWVIIAVSVKPAAAAAAGRRRIINAYP